MGHRTRPNKQTHHPFRLLGFLLIGSICKPCLHNRCPSLGHQPNCQESTQTKGFSVFQIKIDFSFLPAAVTKKAIVTLCLLLLPLLHSLPNYISKCCPLHNLQPIKGVILSMNRLFPAKITRFTATLTCLMLNLAFHLSNKPCDRMTLPFCDCFSFFSQLGAARLDILGARDQVPFIECLIHIHEFGGTKSHSSMDFTAGGI